MIDVIPNMTASCFYYKGLQQHKSFSFVTTGKLVHVKAFDLLIDAFAEAFRGDESIMLTTIGGGKLYHFLERQISKLHMEKQITLTGYKEPAEVADIYRIREHCI